MMRGPLRTSLVMTRNQARAGEPIPPWEMPAVREFILRRPLAAQTDGDMKARNHCASLGAPTYLARGTQEGLAPPRRWKISLPFERKQSSVSGGSIRSNQYGRFARWRDRRKVLLKPSSVACCIEGYSFAALHSDFSGRVGCARVSWHQLGLSATRVPTFSVSGSERPP